VVAALAQSGPTTTAVDSGDLGRCRSEVERRLHPSHTLRQRAILRKNSRTDVWIFSLSHAKVQNVYAAYWLYYVKSVRGLMAISRRPPPR